MQVLTDAYTAATGEGVARRAAPSPSGACWSVSRMAAVAVLGYVVVALPVVGNPMQDSGTWTCCGVLICVVIELLGAAGAIGRCVRRDMLPCASAISIGITIDFLRVPPQALLDLCSIRAAGANGWLDAIGDHWRWFPVTMLSMVIAIVLPRLCRPSSKRAGDSGRVVAGLGGIAFDLVIMALVMTACMSAMRNLAAMAGVSWVAGGVVCAMLVGMLAFTLTRAVLQRMLTLYAQRAWRHALGSRAMSERVAS